MRTKTKTGNRIVIGSDLHLRDDVPACRKDDYFEAQRKKLEYIRNLCDSLSAPLIVAGDIFDAWKSSPYLISFAIQNLPLSTYVIPGQHDLPQHNLQLFSRSALFVLCKARRVKLLGRKGCEISSTWIHGFGYGSGGEAWKVKPVKGVRRVGVFHFLTFYKEKPPIPRIQSAQSVLRRYKGFDLIVVGDNHESYMVEEGGRIILSPGAMMRMAKNEEERKPHVYVWDVKENSIERKDLPIEKDVMSERHKEKAQHKVEIEAFIERLKTGGEIKNSFERNLEKFFKKNKGEVDKETEEIVWKALQPV